MRGEGLTAANGGGGGGGRPFNGGLTGYVGADPVTGQPVRSGELAKATPTDVMEYLKQYNELDGEENEKDKEGTASTAGTANVGSKPANAFSTEAGGNETIGGDGPRDRNSEGRARDAAPVASTGAGPLRQSGTPKGG